MMFRKFSTTMKRKVHFLSISFKYLIFIILYSNTYGQNVLKECALDSADTLYKLNGIICNGEFSFKTITDSVSLVFENGRLLERNQKSHCGRFLSKQIYSNNESYIEYIYQKYEDNPIFCLVSIVSYRNRGFHGTTYDYYPCFDILKSIITYQKGVLHGLYEYYYPHQLALRGYYLKGEMDSIWTEWSTDGIIISQKEYYNGKLNNILLCNAPDGTPRPYGTIKDGSGIYIEYEYIEDSIYMSRKCAYLNGIKHGGEVVYNVFNQIIIEECNYYEGIKNGPYKKYYGTGMLMEEGTYLNGKIHGKVLKYGSAGQLLNSEHFDQGVKTNTEKFSEFNLNPEDEIKNINSIKMFLMEIKRDSIGYEGYKEIFQKYSTPIDPYTGNPRVINQISVQGLDTMKVLLNADFSPEIVPYMKASKELISIIKDITLSYDPGRKYPRDPWPSEYYLVVFKDHSNRIVHIQYFFLYENGIWSYSPKWYNENKGDFR